MTQSDVRTLLDESTSRILYVIHEYSGFFISCFIARFPVERTVYCTVQYLYEEREKLRN